MSHLLWKYYLEDDVEKFRRLLANADHSQQYSVKNHGGSHGNTSSSFGTHAGSPVGSGTSPRASMKFRKISGQGGNQNTGKLLGTNLGKTEINSRDRQGRTVLHLAASSTSANATSFALALIEHPAIDLYVQDYESGWTTLHRALYFGNIQVARALINRDLRDPTTSSASKGIASLIKVKDHEGNRPFDVYNATIARRTLQLHKSSGNSDGDSDEEENEPGQARLRSETVVYPTLDGDELFAFGSNKNFNLGFGDEDDRHHPEKIVLKRPDHLLFRFYREYVESIRTTNEALYNSLEQLSPKSKSDLPSIIQSRPIVIQDVAIAKLHSAILTTDPESNLYVCGFGPGGRLGTGDEQTRFNYVCIEDGALAGKKVTTVALGQNHTLAVSSEGEVFTWGTNTWGQLGYTLPRPAIQDQEPVSASPRQIFGPLKKESIIGVAASAIHSVAHTSTSLYTWGKNEGQLGLMDSDSRSLEIQPIPRKVAASLFKSPIIQVSAINRATTCLLANHTVCVFTNYGYNMVKFPLHDAFSNYHLRSPSFTTRYDTTSNHISFVTSGGDTIAAVSSRGDLFTMNVSQKLDVNPTATSTTNPSKIKGALSSPQRIWSLRKGHWDGIKSVGVAENGSVIFCTHAGAVWRRVKGATIKDTNAGRADSSSKKDFKFQRVPGLTKVTAVRSNTFGVYAAIRTDCDVTKTQIEVEDQTLWEDLGSLLDLNDLQPSELQDEEESDTPRYWTPAIPKDIFNGIKYAVLTSPDIEVDVERHLKGLIPGQENYDVELCSSTSDVRIPVHGFMLAARSPVMRSIMSDFRKSGSATLTDVLTIERIEDMIRITFQGLDFLALLNLAIYIYSDTVVDVWHFTRPLPKMAFRFRQVRVELMKLASNLKMEKLEGSVRLMTEPVRRLDRDMSLAIQDERFFEDGDAIVELEESEMLVHSALLRQRCPFFEGLFHGRAAGQWLAGRRTDLSDPVRIDMKHIDQQTFELVLRYLYADVGTDLFDDVVSSDIDVFSDLVMDVMGVANELMLDRLSQICQQVLGRFVNTRNACHLLNAVAPCSVTEFKDTGLEYLCLQLESMLENRLLDDLDDDLLGDLEDVVRANQLNCLPFAKSGRAELVLHERHPSLAGDIDEERQRKIRDIGFIASSKDEDNALSSSYKVRVGSLGDTRSGSPLEKGKRTKAARNAPFSPMIRAKDSIADLMFDMDDEEPLGPSTPKSPPLKPVQDPKTPLNRPTTPQAPWNGFEPSNGLDVDVLPNIQTPKDQTSQEVKEVPQPKTWGTPLPSAKLDMREIMAQASSSRTSTLSMNLSAQKAKEETASKATPPKLSQKERKKQQQQQALLLQAQAEKAPTDNKAISPWQVVTGTKTSLSNVLGPDPQKSHLAVPPIATKPGPHRRTASPDTRFAGQNKASNGIPIRPVAGPPASSSRRPLSNPGTPSKIIPQSKSYFTPPSKAEPSIQLSMADIMGQQRREQEIYKEAVAKKSLQEIQEEQAFQEWWDQESKRTQEEEAARARTAASAGARSGKGSGGGRGRGDRGSAGRRRGGGRGRGRGRAAVGSES
ncbi:hypothetical protein F5884DRAFT_852632 [Xylogone sp. PMI_703]|nr:hypothetical protein F5884DRAFT_852632 [Xylogone sp. PMI_703]